MKNKPQKLTISEQRERDIKNKYKYSEVHVFSPSFLEEYKEAILRYFPKPERQDVLRENMEKITEFIIGDRVNRGLSRLCCSAQTIHMDTQYAEITEDSFEIKPGCEYIQTIFVHELLHAASRQTGNQRNLTGILDFIRDENGNVVKGSNNRKYIALNEGITQFFAERIMAPVSNEIDSYTVNKQVAYLLSDILGEDVLKSSYFEHTTLLKDTINGLAQDNNYFEELNRQLDTINKLESTIRRIESGKLKPENKDECLARMREVSKAQQAAMMEGLFAKVIIPQVQKIEVPPVTNAMDNAQIAAYNEAMQKRQAFLLPILQNNPELLVHVAKYIPKHNYSEFIRDDVLAEIQNEIKENGMSFEKIANAAKSTNDRYIIGPKIAKDFLGAVDEFYEQNQDALKDRSTTLTPLLKRQLEKMVEVLDQLEEMVKKDPTPEKEANVRSYREGFLKKHFHMIPNLDEEIEKIRQEKKNGPKQEPPKKPEAGVDPLEVAKRKGREQATTDSHQPKPPEESEKQQQEEEASLNKKATLSDKFIIDNRTAAITDQRKLSIYDRAVNIAAATGETVTVEDEVIATARNQAVARYSASLPNIPPGNLGKVYGDRWREVLIAAFEEGYNIGMQQELQKAQSQGSKIRGEVQAKIDSGKYEASNEPVDFEEMKFVRSHFEVRQTESGEIVVDKESGQPVLDERTKQTVIFTNEWIKVNGEQAFTPECEEIYRFVQVEIAQGKELTDILVDAEAMGDRYKKVTEALLENEESKKKVEAFFGDHKSVKQSVSEQPKKETQPENEYSSMSLEDVTEMLNRYTATPTPKKEGEQQTSVAKVFNDPIVGAKMNARYRELKGEDHPGFVAETPAIIDRLQQQKDLLIQAGAYSQEYFDQVQMVQKDLESRHPELVSDAKEKTGSK